ncbi:54S ribosomal protein yml6, mitochondrial [Friedmanniomyces endolithicus]|uniref:Large ribosomal subunit protein uL4m n=2 Tax=Friedmanniomyces endolithicus TaxID=329885 RepID=A0AAN6FJF6_9PEZI|nr:54S ribosomal protein yml6, mitochondrial [Friedmanniomyces endolithicus]KAK0267873.1 54S ribosomal protein yml6, mitochondrial [Friedmanniomyces endolithicus]KAK0273582.1 54S ribosomal protein yml6, mitochondrial [Friedmanniomyces endolithicus]KAK0318380.1 54S ribosomal protein yml6, mitochondrial [Friedmanniomyces endolithicus]KAK0909147.1 54S ribosomal protein yml6, mitochondrial [Friedmanniomyces endolithicus]
MATKRLKTSANLLCDVFHRAAPRHSAPMATVAPSTTLAQSQAYLDAHLAGTPTASPTPAQSIPVTTRFQAQPNPFIQTATLTTNAFPSFEPTGFATYPSTHLLLPLRKDILHRAVIYEGDMTRQGTASTKYRSEVHGSNRKIRPQKGTGKARLGNKKSPMLRGGGVAFGPHPRDFSTGLQRKVYDLAWRTALSYRYRQGELILIEGDVELEGVHENSAERYLKDLLKYNRMGHEHGRTLFVTRNIREGLYTALEGEHMGKEARAKDCADVDVKDLLELGRVVMERSALEYILGKHEEDLAPEEKLHAWSRVARRAAYEERTRAGHNEDALPMAA